MMRLHTPQKMFQSTPPRRGRQLMKAQAEAKERVSIHAPAQGATSMTP